MTKEKNSTSVEVARLEEKVNYLSCQLAKIIDNHLPHITNSIEMLSDRIDKLENRMSYYIGGIAVAVVIAEIILRTIIK